MNIFFKKIGEYANEYPFLPIGLALALLMVFSPSLNAQNDKRRPAGQAYVKTIGSFQVSTIYFQTVGPDGDASEPEYRICIFNYDSAAKTFQPCTQWGKEVAEKVLNFKDDGKTTIIETDEAMWKIEAKPGGHLRIERKDKFKRTGCVIYSK